MTKKATVQFTKAELESLVAPWLEKQLIEPRPQRYGPDQPALLSGKHKPALRRAANKIRAAYWDSFVGPELGKKKKRSK